MKRKLLKQEGVTLLELLITISLVGLIFGLGIYPMLSQIRLTWAERAEMALFDDANLAANYITRDAMLAEEADNGQDPDGTTSPWVEFTINAVSLRSEVTDPSTRTLDKVRYYVPASPSDNELRRKHTNNAGNVIYGDISITNKLNGDPSFALLTNTTLHRLECHIHLLDQPADISTRRDFDVMLRCRDARLVKP